MVCVGVCVELILPEPLVAACLKSSYVNFTPSSLCGESNGRSVLVDFCPVPIFLINQVCLHCLDSILPQEWIEPSRDGVPLDASCQTAGLPAPPWLREQACWPPSWPAYPAALFFDQRRIVGQEPVVAFGIHFAGLLALAKRLAGPLRLGVQRHLGRETLLPPAMLNRWREWDFRWDQ